MNKNVPTVTAKELAMVSENLLNENQLKYLLKKTPSSHVYERTAKGGGKWKFVTGVYIKKVLNLMFGWDWSFEVVEYKIDLDVKQAFVLGKLTVNTGGKSIVKMQFGRVDIKFKKADGLPLDVGNDLKAATTDALKKCAAELGIASDVYAPEEFKEIAIISVPESNEDKKAVINNLLDTDGLIITEDDRLNFQRILDQNETASFDKAIKMLTSKLPK